MHSQPHDSSVPQVGPPDVGQLTVRPFWQVAVPPLHSLPAAMTGGGGSPAKVNGLNVISVVEHIHANINLAIRLFMNPPVCFERDLMSDLFDIQLQMSSRERLRLRQKCLQWENR